MIKRVKDFTSIPMPVNEVSLGLCPRWGVNSLSRVLVIEGPILEATDRVIDSWEDCSFSRSSRMSNRLSSDDCNARKKNHRAESSCCRVLETNDE